MTSDVAAMLALEDGSVFHGNALGSIQSRILGEVVFNTAMSGYQEILTDPSYSGQMIVLTNPHIGNVGVNVDDDESGHVHALALIMRSDPLQYSNWRAEQGLVRWLEQRDSMAVASIDTRRLTHRLREKGAMRGCIMSAVDGQKLDPAAAVGAARDCPGLSGVDMVSRVTVSRPYQWNAGCWGGANGRQGQTRPERRVTVYDFGVKRNILRLLVDQGCHIKVVPATTPIAEVLAEQPDGIVLSNGPGDPSACAAAITAARGCLDSGLPVLGVCLGYQLLALACGAHIFKMKFGHHGANHPVRELAHGRVYITSQNHCFAVDPGSIPAELEITHISLFDGSVQGIRHRHRPILGFQGHPEASPGPDDIKSLFSDFVALMQ